MILNKKRVNYLRLQEANSPLKFIFLSFLLGTISLNQVKIFLSPFYFTKGKSWKFLFKVKSDLSSRRFLSGEGRFVIRHLKLTRVLIHNFIILLRGERVNVYLVYTGILNFSLWRSCLSVNRAALAYYPNQLKAKGMSCFSSF